MNGASGSGHPSVGPLSVRGGSASQLGNASWFEICRLRAEALLNSQAMGSQVDTPVLYNYNNYVPILSGAWGVYNPPTVGTGGGKSGVVYQLNNGELIDCPVPITAPNTTNPRLINSPKTESWYAARLFQVSVPLTSSFIIPLSLDDGGGGPGTSFIDLNVQFAVNPTQWFLQFGRPGATTANFNLGPTFNLGGPLMPYGSLIWAELVYNFNQGTLTAYLQGQQAIQCTPLINGLDAMPTNPLMMDASCGNSGSGLLIYAGFLMYKMGLL